jgi:uncharacterized membrane protein YbaN (DUF454 family)
MIEKGLVYKESEEEINEYKSRTRIVKFLYLTTGLAFLGLGLLGMVLPVLPTTPFLLITTYCFAKGSSRFHQWFCHTHIYQKYIENYIKERAMPLKTKLSILIFATTVMMIAFVTIRVLPARCFLIAVMLFHWWYFFFRIKTK